MKHIKRFDEMFAHGNDGMLFGDMPSAETEKCRETETDKGNVKSILNSEPAKSIIKKYNAVVGYADDITLAMFFEGNPKGDNKIYWKNKEDAEKRFQELLHELDLNTELFFNVGYAGNVGWNARKNIYDATIYSYKEMMRETEYSFLKFYSLKRDIADFARVHGAENTMCMAYLWNRYRYNLKGYKNSTDIKYEDIKNDILEYAKSYIGKKYPNYEVGLSVGKRANDGDSSPYEAFVVKHKGGDSVFHYVGSFVIKQNKFGDGTVKVRVPLAGEHVQDLDFNNWQKSIENVIDFICK